MPEGHLGTQAFPLSWSVPGPPARVCAPMPLPRPSLRHPYRPALSSGSCGAGHRSACDFLFSSPWVSLEWTSVTAEKVLSALLWSATGPEWCPACGGHQCSPTGGLSGQAVWVLVGGLQAGNGKTLDFALRAGTGWGTSELHSSSRGNRQPTQGMRPELRSGGGGGQGGNRTHLRS